ncbi:MAG: Uncharacterised protein [Flavobacteriales bacterium UBA4585]|nr:MAG: Uncharacterised protein [Flavobacteriales bacterium UBA4585]
MIEVYKYIEFILLSVLALRILLSRRNGLRIDNKQIEIFWFYFIWYTHSILTLIIPNTTLTFYFVHCTFPIILPGAMLFKARPFLLCLSIVTILFISLYFPNRKFIDLTYLLTYALILIRIYRLNSLNKRSRGFIPVYSLMLAVLVLTHLVFMFGYVKVDWSESIYTNYFAFLLIMTYLSSLTLIHVQFRRYFTH